MSYVPSKPPSRDCGLISPITVALRPPITLTEEQQAEIRRHRKQGVDVATLASMFGCDEADINVVVATLRTYNRRRTRGTINGSLGAESYIKRQRRPGEPIWQTLDRICEEHARAYP